MLKIRLSRIGKKNKPLYRLIVSESSKDLYGRSLEILGSYNPYSKELIVKKEKIEHWIKNGAGMSPTVNNLLIENSVISGEKVKASKMGKKKKQTEEKAPEKKEEKVEEKVEEKASEKVEEKKEESVPEKKEEKIEEKKDVSEEKEIKKEEIVVTEEEKKE